MPVLASPDQVKQAILNIAINGLEVLPESGQLRIALERAGGTARVLIADDGPGIPPELRDKIFEMHFTTKETGTGIGLYVARSIVESQGGTVEIVDSSAAGTTFAVTLPLHGSEG